MADVENADPNVVPAQQARKIKRRRKSGIGGVTLSAPLDETVELPPALSPPSRPEPELEVELTGEDVISSLTVHNLAQLDAETVKARLESMEAFANSLVDELKSANAQLAAREAKIKRLEFKLANTEEDHHELLISYGDLEEQLAEARGRIYELAMLLSSVRDDGIIAIDGGAHPPSAANRAAHDHSDADMSVHSKAQDSADTSKILTPTDDMTDLLIARPTDDTSCEEVHAGLVDVGFGCEQYVGASAASTSSNALTCATPPLEPPEPAFGPSPPNHRAVDGAPEYTMDGSPDQASTPPAPSERCESPPDEMARAVRARAADAMDRPFESPLPLSRAPPPAEGEMHHDYHDSHVSADHDPEVPSAAHHAPRGISRAHANPLEPKPRRVDRRKSMQKELARLGISSSEIDEAVAAIAEAPRGSRRKSTVSMAPTLSTNMQSTPAVSDASRQRHHAPEQYSPEGYGWLATPPRSPRTVALDEALDVALDVALDAILEPASKPAVAPVSAAAPRPPAVEPSLQLAVRINVDSHGRVHCCIRQAESELQEQAPQQQVQVQVPAVAVVFPPPLATAGHGESDAGCPDPHVALSDIACVDVSSLVDEQALLAAAVQIARSAISRCAPPIDAAQWAWAEGLAQQMRGLAGAGRQHRRALVRFTSHDLSSVSPPRVQQPGSEAAQEQVVAQLSAFVRYQLAVLASPAPLDGVVWLGRAAKAIAASPMLARSLQPAAQFYAAEIERLATCGVPVLCWRLAELLSSTLRFHLSSIFAEEEGHPDPLIASIRSRVNEHAAAHGFEVGGGAKSEENFAAVVSQALRVYDVHAHLVEPGSTSRVALTDAASMDAAKGGDASALLDLPSAEKDGLLMWAQSHSVLMQIFGSREVVAKLESANKNAHHFARLGYLADLVRELRMEDEAYFTPLCDVDAFNAVLHAQASLSRTAREKLQVYCVYAKRCSGRRASLGPPKSGEVE